MYRSAIYYLFTLLTISSAFATPRKPFPQNEFHGTIMPNNVTMEEMNRSIEILYDDYKATYLQPSLKRGYFYSAYGTGEGGNRTITVSEQHGYAMIITALMAGYDKDAKEIFDGLYLFYKDNPSVNNSWNMSWIVDSLESGVRSSSASDGDFDIAYALILAHYQWGSEGRINYLEAAKNLINYGIKGVSVSTKTHRTLLGDWSTTQWVDDHLSTRSSDWMTNHFHAFYHVTGDPFWREVVDTVYSIVGSIRNNYSPTTGLMPDFITGVTPEPCSLGGGTGEPNATLYWYNACRFPWRMAVDYAHYGSRDAHLACSTISFWLRDATNADPQNIRDGYTLDGIAIKDEFSASFSSPFAAGLITDASNQEYLNKIWEIVKEDRGRDSYGAALTLMSALLITGNWWIPVEESDPTKEYSCHIHGGIGSGNYRAGDIVEVVADGNNNLQFYRWVGDLPQGVDPFNPRLSFQMPARSIFITAIFNDPSNPSDTSSLSENLIDRGIWNGHTSAAGSNVSIIENGNNSIDFTISVGQTNPLSGIYAWSKASLTLNRDLSAVNLIAIRYSSDRDVRLVLDQRSLDPSGGSHFYTLPASQSDTTLYIPVSHFSQPQWISANLRGDVDMSDLYAISLQGIGERTRTEIKLHSLRLNGASSREQVVSIESGSEQRIQKNQPRVSGGNFSIYLNNEEQLGIEIYDLRGRIIHQSNIIAKAGLFNFSTAKIGASPGLYLIRVSRESGVSSFKINLN